MTNGVFSEYELREMGIKFKSGDKFESANCVGSSEEELDAVVIKKKCRGVPIKTIVKGKGTGKLSVSMHIPWAIYTKMYGMNLDSLIDGVKAYGINSVHESFAVTQHVFDEDGDEKFKAYPNCVIESGSKRKIENGAEEVAEIELEISLSPDEHGNCVYEALAEELTDETAKTNWMTAFTVEMVQTKNA